MSQLRPYIKILSGNDAQVHRLLRYWTVGLLLYAICLLMLLFETAIGVAPVREAGWLTAVALSGLLCFYGLIRASRHMALSAVSLNTAQALYAITCIIMAYALVGPVRGATLCILVVVLVFSAFSSTPRQALRLGLFAIVLLGLVMLWKMHSDPQAYPPQDELVHFVLATSMLVVVAYLTGLLSALRNRLRRQKTELELALTRIQALATRDELTGLANRRHMNELLTQEKMRHDRKAATLSVALLDIDWFKRINDTHGHAVGDAVLRNFAQQAQAAVRSCDVLARWGGEEFLLLMPDTGVLEGALVLERIQKSVKGLRQPGLEAVPTVTFSAGLSASLAGEPVADALERADRAMYQAKTQGRNQVALASEG